MSESGFPIPPPTFEFLVLSLKRQAEMLLGLMRFGEEEPEPDLAAARHVIDMLAMLAEKTRGNLSLEEKLTVDNSLTELRFRFVQISGEVATKPSREAAAGGGGSGDTGAGESTQGGGAQAPQGGNAQQ